MNATLLGIAAIVSALGGAVSTVYALKASRSEEQAKCLERLKAARAEAEEKAAELHERKMRDAEEHSTGGRRSYSDCRGWRPNGSSDQPERRPGA